MTLELSRKARKALFHADPESLITLYTQQCPTHWAEALKTGVLRADLKKSFYCNEDPDFAKAYRFLICHMRKHVAIDETLKNFSPIWAFPCFPEIKDNKVFLELRVPRKRIVFSLFSPWEDIMLDSCFVFGRTGEPPRTRRTYLKRRSAIFDIVNFEKLYGGSKKQIVQATIDHIDLAQDVIAYNHKPFSYP